MYLLICSSGWLHAQHGPPTPPLPAPLRCCAPPQVIPVSIIISILGCWASLYHLALKWAGSADRGGSWGCNLLQH